MFYPYKIKLSISLHCIYLTKIIVWLDKLVVWPKLPLDWQMNIIFRLVLACAVRLFSYIVSCIEWNGYSIYLYFPPHTWWYKTRPQHQEFCALLWDKCVEEFDCINYTNVRFYICLAENHKLLYSVHRRCNMRLLDRFITYNNNTIFFVS